MANGHALFMIFYQGLWKKLSLLGLPLNPLKPACRQAGGLIEKQAFAKPPLGGRGQKMEEVKKDTTF